MLFTKKGQIADYPIASVVVIFIALLLLAPVMLKIVNDILDPLTTQIGAMSGTGGDSVEKIHTTFVNFWDFLVVIGFLVVTLLLFISAWFIDTNPLFIILYVILSFVMITFAPDLIRVVDQIYDSSTYLTETTQLPLMDFLRSNFEIFILGIIIITGVIIYGKLKWGRGNDYN